MHDQMGNWRYQDSRQRVRFQNNAQVTIRFADRTEITGKLRDISLEGLYFYVSRNFAQELPLDTTVSVSLLLVSGPGSLCMEHEAVVSRVDHEGIALRFVHPFQFLSVFSILSAKIDSSVTTKKHLGKSCGAEPATLFASHRAAA